MASEEDALLGADAIDVGAFERRVHNRRRLEVKGRQFVVFDQRAEPHDQIQRRQLFARVVHELGRTRASEYCSTQS